MLDPQRCHPADVSPPAGWNEAKDGVYDAVFDGHIVLGTICDRIPVDYVDWRDMVADTSFAQLVNYDPRWIVTRRALDKTGRPRMPYAFGTDDAVEAGIPSTYQHDNGADIYEEMQFHDSLYEDRHIFDNFRRSRVNFSIYGAYQRALSRYHGKISSLAQQYSFIHDYILRDSANGSTAAGSPVSYADLVAAYEGREGPLRDFAIASALAFDHFVRVATRPQPGPHSFVAGDNEVIRPLDGVQFGSPHQLDIPQGSMGIGDGSASLTDVSYGGRPIQNSVVSSSGYYNVNQAGSYYEKTHAIYNIVAQGMGSGNWSRAEGIDSRWLSSNFSNLYPDGVRRLIGVLVTDDQVLYSPRVATRLSGFPDVSWNPERTIGYPSRPLGWVSFVSPEGPQVCWPTRGTQVCANPADPASAAVATAPSNSVAIDPELGFEIQKFVLFYSYVFLPASQRNDWVDMLRIFKLGTDTAPAFDPAEMVEWKDPQTGYRYLAKRFGDEQLFGKTYDKGIGAKMVQWANYLASKAYVPADAAAPTDPQTGRFIYKVDDKGLPVVQPDSLVAPSSPTLTCSKTNLNEYEDGQRRHLRPGRRRLLALLGRRPLDRPALREDALRQRAARPRLPARLAGQRRRVPAPRGRGDAGLDAARAAPGGGRLRERAGRRLRGRRGPLLRLDAGAGARGAAARARRRGDPGLRHHRAAATSRARASPCGRRPTRTSLRALKDRAATRHANGACAPGLDDKRLASWNALAISALADAGRGARAHGLPRRRAGARRRSCSSACATPTAGCCGRSTAASPKLGAYLEDHAYLVEALLTLYEATFEERWFVEARRLADETIAALRRPPIAAASSRPPPTTSGCPCGARSSRTRRSRPGSRRSRSACCGWRP